MRAVASIAAASFLLLGPCITQPSQAQQQQATLVAINECDQRLSLLVSAVPESGKRETHGWFNLAPGSNQTLFIAGGDPLTHNPALPFFIYATNADESLTWGDKDFRTVWQGRSYDMQRRDLAVVDGTGPFAVRAVRIAC